MIVVKAFKWFSYASGALILAMIALSILANSLPVTTTIR